MSEKNKQKLKDYAKIRCKRHLNTRELIYYLADLPCPFRQPYMVRDQRRIQGSGRWDKDFYSEKQSFEMV